jgi:hypothetical protein
MPSITFDGSEAYLKNIFCLGIHEMLLKLLNMYDSIFIFEDKILRVDSEVKMSADGEKILTIRLDKPSHENIKILVDFATKNLEVAGQYMPHVEIILKLHASQINNLFRGYEEIKEIIEDYTEFMKNFLKCLISSLLKILTLKTLNQEELSTLKGLEGMTDPFKMDIAKEFPTTSLYYALADNVWREYLGWRIPKTFYERVNVEGFKDLFQAFLKALSEEYKSENNKRAAQKLTTFTLAIFGVKFNGHKDDEKTNKYTV